MPSLLGQQAAARLGGRSAVAPRPSAPLPSSVAGQPRHTSLRAPLKPGCSRRMMVAQASARSAPLSGTRVLPNPRKIPGPYIHGAVTRRGNRIVISAVLAGVEGATDVRKLMDADIKPDDRLVTGQLDNGLRYVILPNKLPPQRFEAHLEIHAGSVDELPNEQGIAHLVEHVTFLGSQRREKLLGSGARANAYTDFHHTVFHVHSPLLNKDTKAPLLPQVLEALQEIAFNPQFLPLRIEKERKAVMAEAQMMNTIEYRVDCQLLRYLHSENNLGFRFPIGKMDQVQKWPHSQLREFWSKWYFPANATLYVVGDLDRNIDETKSLIAQVFGGLPAATTTAEQVKRLAELSEAAADGHQSPAYVALPAAPANGAAAAASTSAPAAANGTAAASPAANGAAAAAATTLLKQRHAVRPPVVHNLGYGPLPDGFTPAPVNVFRHPLLQLYMLSVFCKLPIVPMSKMEHLQRMFLIRVLLSVFQFRVNKRYVAADPPFMGISLDISDSGREGCMVCTLTVTCEPKHWRGATRIAIEEARRLQRYGVTPGEFERYKKAILRDSAQLAEQGDKIPSLDTLNFVMESLACGHTVMEHRDAHDAMISVVDHATLEDVNMLARSMMSFASDYGHEGEILAEAREHPEAYGMLGPTRSTSVLVCIPAFVTASGDAATVAGAGATSRASLGASGHIDVDQVDLSALEEQSRRMELVEEMVPEGAQRFDIAPSEVQAVMADMSYQVDPVADVACPAHLIQPEIVKDKVSDSQPRYVPLDGSAEGDAFPPPDPHSGVVQRRLSNGMRLNYRHTDNEPKGALLRIIANGGQAAQKREVGPDGFGAVVLGPGTMNEAGAVGKWQRDEVEAFCISNLVNVMTDCDEENYIMDMHFTVGDGSMEAAFELLHLYLTEPVWSEEALRRAKTHYINNKGSVSKSLEKATAEKVRTMMFGGADTRQFRDPTDEELEAVTLEGVIKTTRGLMHAGGIEINIVGDIDGAAVEDLVLRYLGTVPPRDSSEILPVEHVSQTFQSLSFDERHTAWHLQDSDMRAVAYIAGPAPARWGPFANYDPLPPLQVSYPNQLARQQAAEARRKHPLYMSCILLLLTEIINSRLFTTVRDSLGLTYDVSFEVTLFDRVRTGWFCVHVTSHPSKIYDAMDASVAVLRDIQTSPINRRELNRARTTILTRHESDLKDNNYWLGLMTHMQNPHVPWKTVTCLRDLKAMYESITVEDIYYVYSQFKLDDDSLYTCIGTSGDKAPEPPEERLVNGIGTSRMAAQDWASHNGGSGQPPVVMNPMAMFTAMLAAAQSLNLKKALNNTNAAAGAAGTAAPTQQQQQQGQAPQQQQQDTSRQ